MAMAHMRMVAVLVAACAARGAWGANQTTDLSPVVVGGDLGFTAAIGGAMFSGTLPAMHSFSRGTVNGEWLFIGGMNSGMHDFDAGFFPQTRTPDVIVIDPATGQVWSRALADATSGLTPETIETLMVTNAQYTQRGTKLYVTGGYGPYGGTSNYKTFDVLTAIDLPAVVNWVKTGTGSAAGAIRQISDPVFNVTGGEMLTTSNGRTHLVFGQDYPGNYSFRLDGYYTQQVRSFDIVDTAAGLSVANVAYGAPQEDFRRRDLNVVPVMRKENGQLVEKMVALAGVFTPDVGAWTVPVTIDSAGVATEPNPALPATFKQGMNSYRSGNVGMYSAAKDEMHTLMFGGISFQYWDAATQSFQVDYNLPFSNDITDIVTDGSGNMVQHLLDTHFPDIKDANGMSMLLGAEAEFFLAPGIASYGNGVIDLDQLTPGVPTVIGWLYGGIASPLPNGGTTVASNGMFPVVITPAAVPEAGTLGVFAVGVAGLLVKRRHENSR